MTDRLQACVPCLTSKHILQQSFRFFDEDYAKPYVVYRFWQATSFCNRGAPDQFARGNSEEIHS